MSLTAKAVGIGYPKTLIEGYAGPKGKQGPLPKGGSVIRKPSAENNALNAIADLRADGPFVRVNMEEL